VSYSSTVHHFTIGGCPFNGSPKFGIGGLPPGGSHRWHYRASHDSFLTAVAVVPAHPIRWTPVGVVAAIETVIGVVARWIPDRKIVWIKIGTVISKHPGRITADPPRVHTDLGRHYGDRVVIPPVYGPFCYVIVTPAGNINRIVRGGTANQQRQQTNLDQRFHTWTKNNTS
jgi:hypothetical protein